MNEELFITGAGVRASSGIPTIRGNDGLWTVGSENNTPQEMATTICSEQRGRRRVAQFLLGRWIATAGARSNARTTFVGFGYERC